MDVQKACEFMAEFAGSDYGNWVPDYHPVVMV